MRAATWIAAAVSAVAVTFGPATASLAAGPGESLLTYQTPPDPIPALLATEAPPVVMVSPRRDSVALLQRHAAPPIAELARPALGLAGLSVDPLNNGPARISAYDGLAFVGLADGRERRASLPADARIIAPVWSPDGRSLAFLMLRADEVELWTASTVDGSTRRVVGGVNAAFPRAYAWSPDSDGFLVRRVVEDRGPAPVRDLVPAGPVAQESEPGRAAPLATVQNLLSDPHDAALFEHYFTSALTRVSLEGGAMETVGPPGLIVDSLPSPDGRYILETRLRRPFSYSVGASDFPTEIVVRDREGAVVRRIADRPLQERASSEVPAGPRAVQWREDAPATLVWAEQSPGEGVRDRLSMLATPFTGAPVRLLDAPGRFSRIFWGRDDLAVVASSADRRQQRTVVDPSRPGEGRRLPDAFEPVMRTDAEGRERLHLTPDGRAMLVRAGRGLAFVDLATGERAPHWSPEGEGTTSLEAVLDDAGQSLLVRRQSRTDPPNLFVIDRAGQEARAVTRFTDPAPQLAGLQQRVLTYRRSDGLPLSATLYLPAGYRPGVDAPLPVLVWAYPGIVADRSEVSGGDRGGEVFQRPQGFDDIDLFLLTQGYAVLRADMPVVAEGDADTIQGHTPQLAANAAAALQAAAATGAVDAGRAAIGGHSFGAAMAANLLAHSDLFRAGVALSGAYNRTLTPFGFQTERRSLWEAPGEYRAISPFNFADQIDEPILLMHGGADPNSGTLPMQSERFFAALKGHGATARYVLLPFEGHEYRARESLQHALWEITEWLNRHVRDSQP